MRYYLLFLLAWSTGYTQINLEKDTLLLDEVSVTKKIKPTVKKFRYKSSCTVHESFTNTTEIVTLVDELSEGYIQSIKFHFNNFMPTEEHLYKLEDTELELVLYEVNPDSTPGKTYYPVIKKILVRKEDAGPMEIDLSDLNIYYPGKLFIGLRSLSTLDYKARKTEVDGICNKNDRYLSYCKTKSNSWKKYDALSALKMEITIAVSK